MRDIILLGFIGVCLTAALRYPYAGLLTWAWFTLMTPHQLAYGVYDMPLNTIIAGVTIGAYVVSGEIAKFRFDIVTVLIILLAGWLTVSQGFSLDPQNSAVYFDRFIKTLLFVLLCAQMTSSKLRFHALVWTLVASIGFFAAKGALFTLVTLGQYRVQGLEQTVLEDNNHFGIAAATMLPLILYLRSQSASPWLRAGLIGLFCLTIIAVIGTHSRGAFLALVTFGAFFWYRSQRKFMILAGLMLILAPTIVFMPAKWTERMTTITEAGQDASFQGRVDAWVINYKLAKANPVTGAGLRNSYEHDVAVSVDPERAWRAKAAHSIYFEILGGAGFVGLIIYLALLASALAISWRIYLSGRKSDATPWKWSFAYYAQISLTVFAIGGASTSMEMWDGYLLVIALIGALMKMPPEVRHETGHALIALRKANWRGRKQQPESRTKPAL
ncbi:MAG: putative O-glycosylation ligase, exosortase A system-associated [Pseudomonadota bacterium]